MLSSSDSLSTTGYFRLTWSSQLQDPALSQYELQRATDIAFTDPKTIYAGPDEASVISGLPNQANFYRVRAVGSDNWSAVTKVEVKHHTLSRALGFFALGALMFMIMLAVLIKGARGRAQT